MSVRIDNIICPEFPQARLKGVSLPFRPMVGDVYPLYEQTTWPDGDTVNEAGEEAPWSLIVVRRVMVDLKRFGPAYSDGDRAFTGEVNLLVEKIET